MAHKTRNSTNDFSLVSLCTVHWCLGAMSGALTQIVYWSSFLFVYGKGLGWHYSSLVPRPHPSARERGSGILSRFSWHFRCLRNSKNHVLAHMRLYEPSEQTHDPLQCSPNVANTQNEPAAISVPLQTLKTRLTLCMSIFRQHFL